MAHSFVRLFSLVRAHFCLKVLSTTFPVSTLERDIILSGLFIQAGIVF